MAAQNDGKKPGPKDPRPGKSSARKLRRPKQRPRLRTQLRPLDIAATTKGAPVPIVKVAIDTDQPLIDVRGHLFCSDHLGSFGDIDLGMGHPSGPLQLPKGDYLCQFFHIDYWDGATKLDVYILDSTQSKTQVKSIPLPPPNVYEYKFTIS